MLSKRRLRNAHIAIAVGAVVLVSGVVLAGGTETDAAKLVVIAMFAAMFGTAAALDARDERRERREGKEPQ